MSSNAAASAPSGSPSGSPSCDPAQLAERLARLRFVKASPRPGLLDLFPDFFIAGPQRTGTSWLNANMKLHPHVQMSEPKELLFFNYLDRQHLPKFRSAELDWYLDHFRLSPEQREKRSAQAQKLFGEPFAPILRGEATASYATLPPEVIDDVIVLNPAIKVIIMLREPVDRAWSHAKKDLGRKAGGIDQVPEKKLLRYFENPDQLARADYAAQIENWRARLRPGHLHLALFEDVAQRPDALLQEIYRFLGLSAAEKYVVAAKRDSVQNATETTGIPERHRSHLESLLTAQIARYQDLRGAILAARGA
ncbi:MAG: sulfotransferase domain-containing protein [Neomegalonema sp.]|nr:sulfotransferase domain-containing protein [Neomegalonema sp.]